MSRHVMLLVDAGNSRLKYQMLTLPSSGAWSPELVVEAPVVSLENDRVSQGQLHDDWQAQLHRLAVSGERTVRLSWLSVGPSHVSQSVVSAFEQLIGHPAPPSWQPQATLQCEPFGCRAFHNHYRNPSQLGADRWVSALGLLCEGRLLPGQTQLVVSAGTATTVDLVRRDAQGDAHFLGGWILPGVGLMEDALRLHTRDLDALMQVPSLPTKAAVPCDSYQAIHRGIGLAQTGFVAQLMQAHSISGLWLHGGHAPQWRVHFYDADATNACPLPIHDASRITFLGLLALCSLRA